MFRLIAALWRSRGLACTSILLPYGRQGTKSRSWPGHGQRNAPLTAEIRRLANGVGVGVDTSKPFVSFVVYILSEQHHCVACVIMIIVSQNQNQARCY